MTKIRFQHVESVRNMAVYYSHTLSSDCLVTNDKNSAIIKINITTFDTNEMKLQRFLCTLPSNCYIAYGSDLATDVAPSANQVEAISIFSAVLISLYIFDAQRPTLERFTFDLNAAQGILDLYFDEVVDPTSVDMSGLTLAGDDFVGRNEELKYSLRN